MNGISVASRLPFFNPELHAMAFSVVGNHAQAQTAVERALSAYALRYQNMDFDEHPWTLLIDDLSEWTPSYRIELMVQLWEILKREKVSTEARGFFALNSNERVALFLRARTPLELDEISKLLELSNPDTVALLERARLELLSREAPGLLEESQKSECRHSMRAEALAALDVERFSDDFLVRHMSECSECTQKYSQAKKKRDAWLAFIPEGTIPRELQREFEAKLPALLKDVLPKNSRSPRVIANRLGRGTLVGFVDLLRAMTKPSFIIPVMGVVLITWAVWASR